MLPSISVLIVTWNSWRDLERCLKSVLETSDPRYLLEVVVVDNGSTDGTPEKLQDAFGERVRLQRMEKNLGLPAAINRGMKIVRGEYVMLLDVDTEVSPGAQAKLLKFLQAHPKVSLAAPLIMTPDGSIEGTARNLPSIMSGLFGRQSTLTRLFPENPFSSRYLALKQRSPETPFQVEQVSAACMFFRHQLTDQAGPWDETYRCYWVDTDWCARLKSIGKTIYCVPSARVTHHENNRSDKKKSPWRIWHFHTGALRLYRKYYTHGWIDPRTILAAALLLSRAGLMLALNALRPDDRNQAQPAGQGKFP